MDYEKLHKDTITKLQEMVNSGKITVETARGICADFVPESEDERMVKFIKNQLFNIKKTITENYELDAKLTNAIDWLEKQGNKDEEILVLKDQIESLHTAIKALKEAHKIELKKQGEQKHFSDFNANDWYVSKVDGKIHNMTYNPTDKVEPKFKMGDVLCDKSCTTLNKNSQPNIEILDIRDGMYICNNCTFPIEQQDEYELVAKEIEQKPAWSEEDEKMCQETIDWFEKKCFPYALESENPARESIKWLKSLKTRYTWKPNDEQMDALESATENCAYSEYQDCLRELIGQLKKLKS